MDAFDDDVGPNLSLDIRMDFHTKILCQRASHGMGLDRCNRRRREGRGEARMTPILHAGARSFRRLGQHGDSDPVFD